MAFSALRHASFRLKTALGIRSTKAVLLFKREGRKVYLWAPSRGGLRHDVLFSRFFHPKRLRRMRRILRENPLDCERLNLFPIVSPGSRLPIGYILDGNWLAENNIAPAETPGLIAYGPVTDPAESALPAYSDLGLIVEEEEEETNSTVAAGFISSSLETPSTSTTTSSSSSDQQTSSEPDFYPHDEPPADPASLAKDNLSCVTDFEKKEVFADEEEVATSESIPTSKPLSSVMAKIKLFEQLASGQTEPSSTVSSIGFTGQNVAQKCLAVEEAVLAEKDLEPEIVPRVGSTRARNGSPTVYAGPLNLFGKGLNFTVTFEEPSTEEAAVPVVSTAPPVVETLDCDTGTFVADLGALAAVNWHKWLVPLLGLWSFSGIEIVLIFAILIFACTGEDEISSVKAASEEEAKLPGLPVFACDDHVSLADFSELAESTNNTAELHKHNIDATDSDLAATPALTPELSEFLTSRLKWHNNNIPRFVRALGTYSDSSLRSGFFRATGSPAISDDLCAQIIEDCRKWAPFACEQVLCEMRQLKSQRKAGGSGNTLAPSGSGSLSGSRSPFAARFDRGELFSLEADGSPRSRWRDCLRAKLHRPFLR